ncbi:MAG: outer membrane lipoprotein-sorting protein [Kiritimatiellaeota bacterium]|nr:outer membrane lipoprotein-sorting protein [Kiritimatiellota bacterium]
MSVDVSAQSVTNNVPAPAIDAPVFTEAEMLLWSCVSRLPSEPYTFTGDIVMRKAYGVELKRLKFKSTICWNPDFAFAKYEIYSEKNVLLETVRAERCGRVQTLTRTVGAARAPAPAPNVNDSIQGTDVTWLDAMMDFVWWGNPVMDGSEKIKGRKSEILKVFPSEPVPGCAYVRLWIDAEQQAVLQATQHDDKGRTTRKMWVRSIQKIDGQWVVKDIEVETPGTGHRTKIHVDDVNRIY